MQNMTLVQTLLSFEYFFFNRSMTFDYKYDIDVLVLVSGELNSHSSRTNLRKEFNSSQMLCHFELNVV